MNEADIRQLLVEHAASLFARGFSVGSAGNISARLPEGAEIVAAFDADEAGRMLVGVVRLAVASVAVRTGTNLIFLVHLPAQDGDDWNQVLQRAAAPEHRQDKTKFVQGEVREVDRQRLGVGIQTK